VAELRRRGYDARALTRGIGAWHAIGGRTVPLDQTSYERCSHVVGRSPEEADGHGLSIETGQLPIAIVAASE
jgi:hypothetical protein